MYLYLKKSLYIRLYLFYLVLYEIRSLLYHLQKHLAYDHCMKTKECSWLFILHLRVHIYVILFMESKKKVEKRNGTYIYILCYLQLALEKPILFLEN